MKTNVNGVELHYDLHGSGPALLFVHGFPLSNRLWAHVIEPLKAEYMLVLPDLRGMGQSGVSEQATMETYADDLAAVLDAAKVWQPAAVIGLSMGGYIAFEFFRRHRRRVGALVLADTRAEADSPEGANGRLETAKRVLAEGSQVVVGSMIDKLFSPTAAPALKEEWRQIMTGTSPVGVAAALRAMARREDSTPTLRDIDVPTLVVVGEDDVLTPPDAARKIHENIPGSRLEVVSMCGHMTPVERPEAFAAILNGFLRSARLT